MPYLETSQDFSSKSIPGVVSSARNKAADFTQGLLQLFGVCVGAYNSWGVQKQGAKMMYSYKKYFKFSGAHDVYRQDAHNMEDGLHGCCHEVKAPADFKPRPRQMMPSMPSQ